MAGDLRGFALEKAELLSSSLKELLSSGDDYVRAQFGVDLGLKPELYPTWVVLCTAAVGLLLIVAVTWAAVCGGLFIGKKRGSLVTQGSGEAAKAIFTQPAKPEEQKKRNKKKTIDKVTLHEAVFTTCRTTADQNKDTCKQLMKNKSVYPFIHSNIHIYCCGYCIDKSEGLTSVRLANVS